MLLLQALVLVLLQTAVSAGASDLFVYGDSPNKVHQGTPWTYDSAGDDWAGVDSAGKLWVCTTGKQQSPINLLTSTAATKPVANEHRADFELGAVVSNGSNIRISNNGHSVQISWTQADSIPKVLITVKDGQPLTSSIGLSSGDKVQQVAAVPRQFHFHAHSEHLMAGHLYPLEAHLVSVVDQAVLPSCPPGGCVVVTGVMFELSDDLQTGSEWLEPLFQAMPLSEGATSFLGGGVKLDLQQLLPANQSYISYAGSLTTPPCSEGVLWVILLNAQKVSLQQWRRFMTAVGDYNCTLQAGSTSSDGSNATQAGTSAANSTVRGRRLLQHLQQGVHPQPPQRQQGSRGLQEQAGQGAQYSCKKLGAGFNFRFPQPLNGRELRVWRDLSGTAGPAASPGVGVAAGAVAGIVIGTTLGGLLTASIGWVAYREYQKRRLKRFYKYGVSNGDMLSVQREVETQWLNMRSGAGSPGPVRPI